MKPSIAQLELDWMFWRAFRSPQWSALRRRRLLTLIARELKEGAIQRSDAEVLAEEAIAAARVTSAIEVLQ